MTSPQWTPGTEVAIATALHAADCEWDLDECLAEGVHRRATTATLTVLADAGLLVTTPAVQEYWCPVLCEVRAHRSDTPVHSCGSIDKHVDIKQLADTIQMELGNWSLGQIGDAGLRDAIHDHWPDGKEPYFWNLRPEAQEMVFDAIHEELYG